MSFQVAGAPGPVPNAKEFVASRRTIWLCTTSPGSLESRILSTSGSLHVRPPSAPPQPPPLAPGRRGYRDQFVRGGAADRRRAGAVEFRASRQIGRASCRERVGQYV